jgi:hypothetical protein
LAGAWANAANGHAHDEAAPARSARNLRRLN